MYQDIKDRTFKFALRIIELSKILYSKKENYILGNQLLRAGTSIGANAEEAVAAYSSDDFIYKMNISLKEARETHYWLRLIQGSNIFEPGKLDELIAESEEIKRVLGAIVSKLRGKTK